MPGSTASWQHLEVADMRFPLEDSPAFANSQVHGVGGRTTAAAQRPTTAPRVTTSARTAPGPCPLSGGHWSPGQDIRLPEGQHALVAVTENGTITSASGYAVYLQGTSGVRHRFLHMDMANLAVSTGQSSRPVAGQGANDGGTLPPSIYDDMHRYVAVWARCTSRPT